MRGGVFLGISLILSLLVVNRICAASDSASPSEPETYRFENYRAPTPLTLAGEPGLTLTEAEALWKSKGAVFIDVLPQAPRPASLAPGTVWRDRPRDDIPGSIWLPDTGYGALAAETEAYFQSGLTAASNGDLTRTMVFYCLKDCWMSWNAAKRAKVLGYSHILWFPGGTDEWAAAGFPLEARKPVPRPQDEKPAQ